MSGGPQGAGYDRFVDWPARLKREAPFFRAVFGEAGVHSVVDVGSGSGRHAVMWAEWGLQVTGVDPDPGMLARAREAAAEASSRIAAAGGSVRFLEGALGGLNALGLQGADALTCTGNALPHVGDLPGLRAALADFAAVLRPGGVLVLHLLDHDRLLAKHPRALPPVVRDAEDATWVFLRLLTYEPDAILIDFLTLHRQPAPSEEGKSWEVSAQRAVHAALPSELLKEELARAGFKAVRLYGDHGFKPLDPETDESVIVTARR